jgi:isochorismate hydrolase
MGGLMATVAVIGGGPNGLAAAICLADTGASVTLLEARDILGGRAASEEFHPGFHTSGVLHDSERVQPWVVDRLGLRKHGLSTMAVPTVVGVGHDGATVLLPSDVDAAVAALDGTQASLGTQWRKWHDEVSLVGRVLAALSAKAPPDISRSASIWSLLGAAMPAKVLNRVVTNSALLAKSAELLAVPVLYTEQYRKGLGPTVAAISEALPATAQAFQKTAFSCTGADGFNETLEQSGRRQVILVGMEAHVCVLQTALDLNTRDLEIFVVEDAICSRRLENYQNALDRLRQSGVHVISAESAIFEWLADSRHEQFKAIQKMLR